MAGAFVGYLCCLVSVVGFGSNYIPVKRVDVKDGVFFSLCLSCGVFLVGLVQWAAFGFYRFEPFAMLGGVVWAVGNACVPFIIQRCGLGAGQLVWSVTNMLTGWACGTFGLLGKSKDTVEHFGVNCAGVAIALLSLVPFAFMRQEDGRRPGAGDAECGQAEQHGARAQLSAHAQLADMLEAPPPGSGGGAPRARAGRRPGSLGFVAGFAVALVAGVFMGSNFNPPTYLQQIGPPAHSADSMDYVISHFSGIALATLAYFLVYAAALGPRRRFCGREVIIPGLLSGLLWGVAQVGWFKANVVLSYVVAFPIIVATPGVMAAIWGVVLFGENRGRRNLLLLAAVLLLQLIGVGLIAASKGSASR